MSGRRHDHGGSQADLKSLVQQELSKLRAREGLTTERVRHVAPTLQRLASADAADRRQPTTPSTPDVTIAFIISGLNLLAERGHSNLLKLGALRAAYGVEVPQRSTVDQRRRDYSTRLLEEGKEARTNETLQSWESDVIPELADVLISQAEAAASKLPMPLQRPVKSLLVDSTYLFAESGAIREGYVVREIEAVREGIDSYQVSHNYFSDRRPGVVQIVPYTDCRIARITHTPVGELRVDLALPAPLRAGERHRLSYKILVLTDQRCLSLLKHQPRSYGEEVILRAQFDQGYLPKQLWTFQEVTDREIPWEPPINQHLLTLSRFGYLEAHFKEMRLGLSYGVAWRWPEPDWS